MSHSEYTPEQTSGLVPGAAPAQHRVLGEFGTYAEAERLVDTLSDRGFPVEHVRIVGTGLRTVERVTGRMTKGRAAVAGAASGAWFGLLLGFLIGLFAAGVTWIAVLLGSMLIGAVWGALFGFLAHLATRGRRDFNSVKGLEAAQYAVNVDAAMADEALRLSSGR